MFLPTQNSQGGGGVWGTVQGHRDSRGAMWGRKLHVVDNARQKYAKLSIFVLKIAIIRHWNTT